MIAEIITIGDEILIGQTIDTNSAWIGRELSLNGIEVKHIVSISDEEEAIISALNYAKQRADLVLITGGLGPTRDDITKQVLCNYFDTTLEINTEVEKKIESFFAERGRPMLEVNRQQAALPLACTVLLNDLGTACGMWFEKNNTVFVSMPGVPYEMKGLMADKVIPLLNEKYELPYIYYQTILTQGIGESFLAEKIKIWENSLEKEQVRIAYLPSPGIVKIRLSSKGDKESEVKNRVVKKINELKTLIPQFIYGEQEQSMEEAIAQLLLKNGLTISTAESCTGGYIASLLTSLAGSSAYFQGSVVAYSYESKVDLLEVSQEDIEKEGAVSEHIVKQMAKGVSKRMRTDCSIAVSGIAGPGGGTKDKPVGTVWIAVCFKEKVVCQKFLFENNRKRNIERTAKAALGLLKRTIEE